MRFVKHIILVASLVAMLAACNKERSSGLINPQLVVELDETNLSDLIDTIRFVPLETNDGCLIGRIKQIKRRNNTFYILADDRVMKFDDKGQFKGVITKIGEGPDEVSMIYDFDISNDNDVAISSSDKIIVFGEDGVVKRKVDLANGLLSVRHIPDGWLVVTSVPFKNGNKLVEFDENWDTIRTMMRSPDFDGPNSNIDLISVGPNRYIHQIGHGNELFEYDTKSSLNYQYKIIDSPEVMTPQEYADFSGNIMESPKHIIRYITTNSQQVLFGVIEDKTIFYYFYDKESQTTYKVNVLTLIDDITGIEITNDPLVGTLYSNDSDDEYFVSYIFGSPEMITRFGAGPSTNVNKDFDDESNPILVLTKFKKLNELSKSR